MEPKTLPARPARQRVVVNRVKSRACGAGMPPGTRRPHRWAKGRLRARPAVAQVLRPVERRRNANRTPPPRQIGKFGAALALAKTAAGTARGRRGRKAAQGGIHTLAKRLMWQRGVARACTRRAPRWCELSRTPIRRSPNTLQNTRNRRGMGADEKWPWRLQWARRWAGPG